jgi:hypothetical protein
LTQEGNRQFDSPDGNNKTGYNGRYLIKDNIVAFNGKGMVVNLVDKADLLNNTIYQNGYLNSSTFTSHINGAGLNINASNDILLKDNVFDLDSNGVILWYNSNASNIAKENNHFKGYFLSEKKINYDGIVKHEANDTLVNSDFTSNIEGVGANLEILKKAKKFAINPKALNYDINKTKIAQLILDYLPSDIKVVDINRSDSKYLQIYLELPQEHPHTKTTGNDGYILKIPQVYASKLKLPSINK